MTDRLDLREVVRVVFLGRDWADKQQRLRPVAAVALFLFSTWAYYTGLFTLGGGVVFVPISAAFLGMAAAFLAGFNRDGALVAWCLTCAPLFGMGANWAREDPDFVSSMLFEHVLRPDAMVYFAVVAAIFGLPAFGLGLAIRETIAYWRRYRSATTR